MDNFPRCRTVCAILLLVSAVTISMPVHSDESLQTLEGDDVPDGVVYAQLIDMEYLQNPNRKALPPEKSEAQQLIDQMCREYKRQFKKGNLDAVSLARYAQDSDDVHYRSLESRYADDYRRMSNEEKKKCDVDMVAIRSAGISLERRDYIVMARSHPDDWLSNLEYVCKLRAEQEAGQ